MKNGMIEDANGTRHWYLNDRLHRTDGPAIEFASGTQRWYLNGLMYNEDEFQVEVALQAWGLSTNA